MQIRAIDHVNLRIPTDGLDEAIDFYQGTLGFDPENLDLYESGEKSFFSIRLNDTAVIHLRPDEEFVPPTGGNYDHVAIITERPIEKIKPALVDEGVEIEMELNPLGATGTAPAIYIRDPFGYLIEIKEANQ